MGYVLMFRVFLCSNKAADVVAREYGNDERAALLLQGNPNYALKETQQIFNPADAIHDGLFVFEEFFIAHPPLQ